MFKIAQIEVTDFWGKFTAKSEFGENVNIIIGKNGTGKTTFMNILYAVLSVDPDGLYENDFSEVRIKLVDGKKTRTITATKSESEIAPFPLVTYFISKHKYILPLIGVEDGRTFPLSHKRRAIEESARIRGILSELVLLASLSVYRFRSDPDADTRDRGRKLLSPVDSRLQELRQKLTLYQYELSIEARQISDELQKSVLISLLYNPDEKTTAKNRYSLRFNADQEKNSLVSAYKQLGLSGNDVTSRIQKHIAAISATVKAVQQEEKLDFAPLEARARTSQVIDMSLGAEKRTEAVFSQVKGFLKILSAFIPEKKFEFVGGELSAVGEPPIPLPKLSSGEKQLLILLIESLLQKQRPFIFLADEPELSLHISWQRQIISAITELNPNAQIIVATHSPEIAGKFSKNIVDMEDILHG